MSEPKGFIIKRIAPLFPARKHKLRQQQKANGAKELHDALKESSSHNGRLLVSFLLFVVYFLITVGGVTDYTLLVPDSTVKLPLLNVELPLFGFFIVAPR